MVVTMTTDEAQQILEALLIWEHMHKSTTASAVRDPAIKLLNERIGRSELPPIAYMVIDEEKPKTKVYIKNTTGGIPLYTTPELIEAGKRKYREYEERRRSRETEESKRAKRTRMEEEYEIKRKKPEASFL
jgi:hypothetical protein